LVGVGTLQTLDTWKEIGHAINNDPNVYTTLNDAITNKQNKYQTYTGPISYTTALKSYK
jgi:hypothetical protein